jgi:hypothetical protein
VLPIGYSDHQQLLSGRLMDWSREEVESIVADYLQMLTMELAGQTYSKTEHRRRLQTQLNNRSDGSIEFKHGNISAAMIDLGLLYVRGNKPRVNYQTLLAIVADGQVRGKTALSQTAWNASLRSKPRHLSAKPRSLFPGVNSPFPALRKNSFTCIDFLNSGRRLASLTSQAHCISSAPWIPLRTAPVLVEGL